MASIVDLRTLLCELEKRGRVLHIKEPIMPEPDLAQFLKAASSWSEDGPALVFDNIVGYKGQTVVGNSLGGWQSLALAAGIEPNSTLYEKYKAIDAKWDDWAKGEIRVIDSKDAPCCEYVIEGDDVNLYNLPLYRANDGDGGFYISKGAIITQDMDSPDDINTTNVGMYRVQIQGKNLTGLQVMMDHDCAHHLRKYEAAGKNMPIAICIGAPPSVCTMATIPFRYNESELKYAAGMQGEDLVMTKTSNGILVPALCEYVLEGEVLCGVRTPEGPFGEFPGTYSGVRNQCQVKINRITHRRNPLWENLYLGTGHSEGNVMSYLITSVANYRVIKERMPDDIVAVNSLVAHGMVMIISAKIRYGNYAKPICYNAASSSAGLGHGKIIIVVDEDVDPFDLESVFFQMAFRIRPDKDVIVVPYDVGMGLDPCNDPVGISGRLMIDATTAKFPDKMRDVVPIKIEGVEEKIEIIKNMLKENDKGGEY